MADPDEALIEAGQIAIHEILRQHTIECTGLGEVSCSGCREVGWMPWWQYRTHVADLAARAAHAALVAHLGLVEERHWEQRFGEDAREMRRLVSRWTEVDHGSE